MAGPEETADFAALIREFKDRSGLSYGVLAKRLHMSTSTLHRYCNGDAVPTEYAPVERFARLCKATPDELVEAHRRWILADGARQRERKAAAGTGTGAGAGAGTGAGVGAGTGTAAAPGPSASTGAPASTAPSIPTPPSPTTPTGTGTEPITTPTPASTPTPEATHPDITHPKTAEPPNPNPAPHNTNRTPRRTTLLAAAAVAVVLAATALVPRLVSGDGDGSGDRKQEAGSVTSAEHGAPSASSKSGAKAKSASSPSSSASPSTSASSSEAATAKAGVSAAPGGKADVAAGVPLTVTSRPYAWESPCSQTYLVDEDAAKVPPPPTEQDAPSWVSALGAVSADSQYLELTVQGTGQETVVLQSLNVRVVQSGAPLAWNAYAMGYVGVGCGGGVPTHSFDVGLDAIRPVASPKAGQTGLPYKVSESDPEVLYITAAAASHDVRWYLELAWTSGTRKGVLRIDDQGKPFHTSGMSGRPRYGYSLDDSEWIPHQGD
ncbi:helix-turn-helix domain-containing protein [Streptomyces sp. NBC_00989]|uniref:helix-turn-helix domain-containing protein n=1 Tax=Streptomyces sp. NBC_00989 TaxID=2903705 RepID=UPI0038684E4B|nr:helix-turn-helix domain-containing protein [Streptomyces sp. NBC_00989]